MASIPTQRTLKKLRAEGYEAEIVEKTIPHSFVKLDFGGFADILAYRTGETGCLAIQTTSDPNLSARIKKMTVPDESDKNSQKRLRKIQVWLGAGNRLEAWGWGKKGERGARKIWTLRSVPITLELFEKEVQPAPSVLSCSP